MRVRLGEVLLALVLTGSLAGGVTPSAGAEQAGTSGSQGIGDPYFPHDGNGGIDVLHYDVRDRYQFGSGRLSGRTRLDVRATQALSRFDLDLLLQVTTVRVDGRRARFEQTGDHELRITPPADLRAGQSFRVTVRYAGHPASESSHGESNWLADHSEVVTMNEPHMATWWFPANDHPLDKASFDIRVTVPKGKRVIANGVLVGKRKRHGRVTAHWRAVEPMATYLAFFAAGSFHTHASRCNGVTNYVAVTRQVPGSTFRQDAATLADQTCRIVTALSRVLGPYPFSAMGGLTTSLGVGFALENQTRPTYPVFSGPNVGLLAHELAHQWFGDSVSVEQWRDIWLNEGFAQYLQIYYVTEVKAGTSMQTWLADTYDAYRSSPDFWKLRIDDPGPSHIFDGPVYDRGAMTLQALRHRIGDDAFWSLLRTWLDQHRYANGSVSDFESLAAAVSGQELTTFFDAWLSGRRPPARTAANGLV